MPIIIDPLSLAILSFGVLSLGLIALFYIRKSEQNLKKHFQELQATVYGVTDGIMMVDPHFQILVANQAVVNLLQTSSLNLNNIFTALEGKFDLKSAINLAYRSGQLITSPEIVVNDKCLKVLVDPVWVGGKLIGVVVVLRDETEEKNLQKMKEEFTSMMVHELRTPLTTINYSVSSILSEVESLSKEVVQSNLGVIKSTSEQMLTLVTDLLDVSKIEAGKFQIHTEENDINSLISEKVAQMEPLAKEKGLYLQFEPNASLPKPKFDKNRVGQVLINLLSNAIKYTDKGGVKIGTSVNDSHLEVQVADTGDGIKEEEIEKLFSKFEQLGKGKTGQRKGTGLGLVISKGIIEAHGGKIWAESQGLGMGSTFSFTLPLT